MKIVEKEIQNKEKKSGGKGDENEMGSGEQFYSTENKNWREEDRWEASELHDTNHSPKATDGRQSDSVNGPFFLGLGIVVHHQPDAPDRG